jgi:hypothetical protein
MTQIHVVIRRINPALKVDFVQVGCIKSEQFSALPLDTLDHTPVTDYVRYTNFSDSPCIDHNLVPRLVGALVSLPNFSIEFFDNTLILMFNADLNYDEGTTKEEE